MLPLPTDGLEPRHLADWLELNALISVAGQTSLDDLRHALGAGELGSTVGASPALQSSQLEQLAAEVSLEIDDRTRRTRGAYPFRMKKSSLERTIRPDRSLDSTYAFCLLMSSISWDNQRLKGFFPERMFEEISCLAAERYMDGDAVRFGWPRFKGTLPGSFGKAVEALCARMGEGIGYRDDKAKGDEQDAGLDLVAWKCIDGNRGKLVLFGACATGLNWTSKLQELQPLDFCDLYLLDDPIPEPSKAFFLPRIVPRTLWNHYSEKAGMLFDRCRISGLVPKLPSMNRHGSIADWMRFALRQVEGN